MVRPFALLRAGFPYIKTLGMRRVTNDCVDVAIDSQGLIYVLCQAESSSSIKKINWDDDLLLIFATGAGGNTAVRDGNGNTAVGAGDGQMTWPVSLILDKDDNVFVSDQALNRISKFSCEGEYLSKWGKQGNDDGQLNGPSGIAFDPEENIYVSDTMNHRIQKFTKDGRFLLKWGEYGSQEGQLNMPWGITVDELGDVYVVDWRNDRIQKFSAQGEFIFALGSSGNGDGEFNRPSGIEVDKDGDIYVVDYGNDRVQLFSAEGRYVEQFIGDASLSRSSRNYVLANKTPLRLREMAKLEPQKRFRRPVSVAVDLKGRMYVTDSKSYRIQIYQKDSIPLEKDDIAPHLRSPTLQPN